MSELKCNSCPCLVWVSQATGPPLQFCRKKHIELTNGYMMLAVSKNCKVNQKRFLDVIKSFVVKVFPDWLFALSVNFYNVFFRKSKFSATRHGFLLRKSGVELLSPTSKFVNFGLSNFESKFERFFKIELDDVCVDVGACIGDTTIPMLEKTGAKGLVFAIEPSPINSKFLVFNLMPYVNVAVLPLAVSNFQGKADFHIHSAPTGHSLLKDHSRKGTVSVNVQTLDNLFGSLPIDFCKIDVQGSEVQVLEGATSFLKSVRKLVVETHSRYDAEKRTYPAVVEMLRKCGFSEVRFCMDNGLVYAWR